MNKINEEELTKQIENFVRQSVLVILNSRVGIQIKPNYAKEKLITNPFVNKILIPQSFTNELEEKDFDDVFLDEYQELKSTKSCEKLYFLEIFFKRKEVKILIERWKFSFRK